jgi:hypothetical protein
LIKDLSESRKTCAQIYKELGLQELGIDEPNELRYRKDKAKIMALRERALKKLAAR